MRKILLAVFWIILIFVINIFGRYFYLEFFKEPYYWLAYFYLEIAGSIASLVSIILFFVINYFINKKQGIKNIWPITLTRFLLMLVLVILVFIAERLYVNYYDYLIFKS